MIKLKNKSEFQLRSLGAFDFKNVEEPIEVYAIANKGMVIPRRSEMKGKLKQKPNKYKIGKNIASYLLTAWVIIEVVNFFIGHFNLEPLLLDMLIIFLVFGLLTNITFNTFKGRWNKKAIMLQVLIILAAFVTNVYYIMNPLDLNPRSLRLFSFSINKSPLQNLSSVAVLPIQNNLPNDENDYLLAGLHDGIITELGRLGNLKIISRTSTLSYAESTKSLKQIGTELDVNSILESSITPSDDWYVYRVRLLNSETEELIWSDEFRTTVSELPILINNVAKIIAITLNPDAVVDVNIHEEINPAAYIEILKGHYWIQKFTKDGVYKSISHFEKAIDLDSTNMEGYLGIASAWSVLQQLGFVSPKIARPKILEYGDKAVKIDSDHWQSYSYRGATAFLSNYDLQKGIQLFEKSIELNPNNSGDRALMAHFYMLVNDWDKAWEQIRYAKEIDPLNPTVIAFEAVMYVNDKKMLSAIKQIEILSLIDPNNLFVENINLIKNRDFGNDDEAIACMKRLYDDAVSDPIALNKFIDREYATTNDVNLTWLSVIRHLQEIDYLLYYPSHTARALMTSIPGYDDDLFFQCLGQMAEDRHPDIPYYARKDGHPLQDDPRYIKIMTDLGLW